MKGEYEPIIEDIISQCLDQGDVAFDVGANVGHFSICMRDEGGPEGTVHAFEPTPVNIELLSKTVEKNGFKNVTVLQKAVGAQYKTMDLHIETQNTGNSTLFPNREYESSIEVNVIPLSDHTKSLVSSISSKSISKEANSMPHMESEIS